VCVPVLRAEVMGRSTGLLPTVRLAQQPDKVVESAHVTRFGTGTQCCVPSLFAEAPVEPATGMEIGERQRRELPSWFAAGYMGAVLFRERAAAGPGR
jgi:hypothetical protein